MEEISNIRDLVNLWPTRSDVARDMMAAYATLKVTTAQVHKWAEKGSIPSKYHHPMLVAGRARGFRISAELLVRLHAPEQTATTDLFELLPSSGAAGRCKPADAA